MPTFLPPCRLILSLPEYCSQPYSDAQWPGEKGHLFFGWLSLKGNPSQKKRETKGTTGQLGLPPEGTVQGPLGQKEPMGSNLQRTNPNHPRRGPRQIIDICFAWRRWKTKGPIRKQKRGANSGEVQYLVKVIQQGHMNCNRQHVHTAQQTACKFRQTAKRLYTLTRQSLLSAYPTPYSIQLETPRTNIKCFQS